MIIRPTASLVKLISLNSRQIERWHHIAFDYSAVAASPAGHVSRSEGR